MKKTVSFLLILALLVLPVLAKENPVHMDDQTGILPPQEAEKLEKKAGDISEFGAFIAVVDTTDGEDAKEYADDYYDRKLKSSYPNGILFLVALEDRKWAVTTSGTCKSAISDREIDRMMDSVGPLLSSGAYYDAFKTFLSEARSEFLSSGPEISEPEIAEDEKNWGIIILVSIGVGLAAGGISLWVMRSNMNTVRPQRGASQYMDEDSYDLYRSQDFYLYSHTTRVKKPENNNSSGGGSSGGRSYGGSSGSF